MLFKRGFFAIVLISSLLLSACAAPAATEVTKSPATEVAAGPAIEWSLAHYSIPGTEWDNINMKVIPERIAKATNGRLKINVITGAYTNPADILPAVKAGRVNMGSAIYDYYGNTLAKWNVLSLPTLLAKDEQFASAFDEIVKPVVEKEAARDWNAKPVVTGAWTGPYFFSNVPVDGLAKFKGVKYRSTNPMLNLLLTELGAAPVSMPFGEVYPNLERGMVQAFVSVSSSTLGAKLQEVTKYMEPWAKWIGVWSTFLNQDALKALPPDLQKIVVEEFAAVDKLAKELVMKEADVATKALQAGGMKIVTLPDADLKYVQKLAEEKVWPTWLKVTGADGEAILKQVRAKIGR